MQEVHTFRRLGVPFTVARRGWMFGFQRREVRMCENDTFLPKPGALPQTSQTEATAASISRIERVCQRLIRRESKHQHGTEAACEAYPTPNVSRELFCLRGDDPPAPPDHGRASPLRSLPTGGRRQNRGAPRAAAGTTFGWLCARMSVHAPMLGHVT